MPTVHARNRAIWSDFIDPSQMGISSFLQSQEDTVNLLGSHCVENSLLIIDDEFRIKWDQLDNSLQLERDKINNEKTIIDMKATNQRLIMALQETTNNYVLNILEYATEVKRLIMNAKVAAMGMRQNEVALAEARAEYAEDKAEIDIQEIALKIKLEEIEQQHVEIEKLRAQLAVARAETQVVLAEIDVAKAEIAVVNARVQKAMAGIQKIQIGIDIAMTAADIVQRQIAGVRLEAEQADINAFEQCIAVKLAAVLALIQAQTDQLSERAVGVLQILGKLNSLSNAQIAEAQVRLEEIESMQAVQAHKEAANEVFCEMLASIEKTVTEAAKLVIDAGVNSATALAEQSVHDAGKTNSAQEATYKCSRAIHKATSSIQQRIVSGLVVGDPSFDNPRLPKPTIPGGSDGC